MAENMRGPRSSLLMREKVCVIAREERGETLPLGLRFAGVLASSP